MKLKVLLALCCISVAMSAQEVLKERHISHTLTSVSDYLPQNQRQIVKVKGKMTWLLRGCIS